MKKIITEANSDDEAKRNRNASLTDNETVIFEEIITYPEIITVEGQGDTTESAFNEARKSAPQGSTIITQNVIRTSKDVVAEYQFWNEADARMWKPEDKYTSIESFNLKTKGKHGLFTKKTPHIFEFTLKQKALVSIKCQIPCKLQSLIGTETEKFDFVKTFVRERIGDNNAFGYAMKSAYSDYFRNLNSECVDIVIAQISDSLKDEQEYWQFCNCMDILDILSEKSYPILPILIQPKFLNHKYSAWRVATIQAIGNMRKAASEVTQLLVDSARNSDAQVKQATEFALKKIRS